MPGDDGGMSNLGHFLEFSVPAPDLGASLDFWLRLGFSEVRVNDIRPRGYAAVTDGQIVIGLHAAGLDEPALTFVRPDLARHARALMDAGTELEFVRLDDDQFNEVGLRTPDGHLLMLLEAPTFSVADDDHSPPLIGRCTELALRSATLEDTRNFFELAGFLGTEGEDDGFGAAGGAGSFAGAPARKPGTPASRCASSRPAPGAALLDTRGIAGRPSGHDYVLLAPEGTRLLLVSP